MQHFIIMMMITIYRAWIYLCRNSMLIVLEWPQSSNWLFLLLTVHAGYVFVAIIHKLWLGLEGLLAHGSECMRLHTGVYGHRNRVCTQSWLWEENPLLHWGIEPASVVWQSNALTSWASFHTRYFQHCPTRLNLFYRHCSSVTVLGDISEVCQIHDKFTSF